MSLSGFLGLVFILVFLSLIIVFAAAGRNRPGRHIREIGAFTRLRRAVGLAVEAGTRLHVTLGWGNLVGIQGASALVGLTMLERIARAASISDRPPVATTGEGSLAILTRDTLQGAYRSLGAESQYEPTSGRLVGLTPFSYAAGTLPVIHDEQVSANVLIGHFGSEVALITNAIDQTGCLAIAGTDSVPAQAVLYATAEEPLIGEEVFAGGAYLGAGSFHEASLRTQDALRWLVIAFMLLAVLFKATGLDRLVTDILAGIFS